MRLWAIIIILIVQFGATRAQLDKIEKQVNEVICVALELEDR